MRWICERLASFLAPAKPGPIVAEAKVTQLGKTIAFIEGKLMAEDSTLLATATASERLLEAARLVR
jgi:acyl-coenzyme A thioesterase PaaI-like protein